MNYTVAMNIYTYSFLLKKKLRYIMQPRTKRLMAFNTVDRIICGTISQCMESGGKPLRILRSLFFGRGGGIMEFYNEKLFAFSFSLCVNNSKMALLREEIHRLINTSSPQIYRCTLTAWYPWITFQLQSLLTSL